MSRRKPKGREYIRIKPGVDLTGMSDRIASKLWRIWDIFAKYGYLTYLTDVNRQAIPGTRSLHPEGKAVDVRGKHIATERERQAILRELIKLFGKDYDVILYPREEGGHYHIEYDPK